MLDYGFLQYASDTASDLRDRQVNSGFRIVWFSYLHFFPLVIYSILNSRSDLIFIDVILDLALD